MPYAAFTDIGSTLKRQGTYTWWVSAHALNGAQIGPDGPTSTFQIRAIAPPSGHQVALSGRASDPTGPPLGPAWRRARPSRASAQCRPPRC